MHTSGRIEPYFAARAAAISRNTAKTIEQEESHSLESVLVEEIKFPISCQEIFNIPVAEIEAIVEPDSVADDIWRESVALICIHPQIVA